MKARPRRISPSVCASRGRRRAVSPALRNAAREPTWRAPSESVHATASVSARGTTARAVYWTAAHLVALAGLRVALWPLANGAALTSAAWGVAAVALVVVGLRRREGVLRGLGLGTIVGTVSKVLLVDLPDVPMIWRVVLFMGLGALLLAVSYAVPGLLRGRPEKDAPAA